MDMLIKILNNIIASWTHLPYTWKHEVAIFKFEKELIWKILYEFYYMIVINY